MKTINTNTAAATTAALNLKVNHQTRTIEMNKTFADKASRFGSNEYDALMLAREQNPGYATKVITRKTTKSDKPSYKGLTYEYMEKYILTHDDEEQTIMNEYMALRGMTEEAEDALAESLTYQEMKEWLPSSLPTPVPKSMPTFSRFAAIIPTTRSSSGQSSAIPTRNATTA